MCVRAIHCYHIVWRVTLITGCDNSPDKDPPINSVLQRVFVCATKDGKGENRMQLFILRVFVNFIHKLARWRQPHGVFKYE